MSFTDMGCAAADGVCQFFLPEGKNMWEQFNRTELLLGREAMRRLSGARVIVFGIGGVGGHAVEALARSGVGCLELVDSDLICMSNLNRQIIATLDTVGRKKTEVMRERIFSINPQCRVAVHDCFYLPETASMFSFSDYDYIVDAVDTVSAKIDLVVKAGEAGVPVISSMGAGNKLNPAMFEVADIYQTSVCPLARVMRREMKKRGIERLKVVYSREEPVRPASQQTDLGETQEQAGRKRTVPGSTAFVPAVAGLLIAGEVVKDLAGI